MGLLDAAHTKDKSDNCAESHPDSENLTPTSSHRSQELKDFVESTTEAEENAFGASLFSGARIRSDKKRFQFVRKEREEREPR
ncbi:hypothetical protein CSKR_203427 [Clonorchis sinensis]|uniref:Uncharacterized protein n=1 Tax=Clonorchis sinensis TaxID=79923 RepID=A0A8T1MC19_CLOSI|nr:hypothetical protein CSKR_203427 [Clonorchis sinensis]